MALQPMPILPPKPPNFYDDEEEQGQANPSFQPNYMGYPIGGGPAPQPMSDTLTQAPLHPDLLANQQMQPLSFSTGAPVGPVGPMGPNQGLQTDLFGMGNMGQNAYAPPNNMIGGLLNQHMATAHFPSAPPMFHPNNFGQRFRTPIRPPIYGPRPLFRGGQRILRRSTGGL